MRVTDLRDALLDVTEKVYHYRAPARDCGSRYICWGETNGSVALSADDTPESLHARIQVQEHLAFPEALRLLAAGRLKVEGRRVRITG